MWTSFFVYLMAVSFETEFLETYREVVEVVVVVA